MFSSWVVVWNIFYEDSHFDYIIFFKGVETTNQVGFPSSNSTNTKHGPKTEDTATAPEDEDSEEIDEEKDRGTWNDEM